MKLIQMILITMLVSLAACSHISSMKVQSEGSKITREQTDDIKPGITTRQAIVDRFGTPSRRETKADGTEILFYTYREKTTPVYFGGFIVNEKKSRVSTITLEITVKNGLVLSYNFKKQEEQ